MLALSMIVFEGKIEGLRKPVFLWNKFLLSVEESEVHGYSTRHVYAVFMTFCLEVIAEKNK